MIKDYLLVVVATLLLGALGQTDHPINPDFVDDIKDRADSWVPHDPKDNPLKDLTHKELHMLLGTRIKPALGTKVPESQNAELPKEFDARTQWKDCIHPVRNQGKCGSCWAFAASEAFSDRVCIGSKGKVNEVYSPEALVECDKTDMGCEGGELKNVWDYLESEGIVTEKCEPYTSAEGKVPLCRAKCANPETPFTKLKCKAGSVVEAVTRQQIMEQIFLYGPMETGFEVYHDFFNYKSGVYHHVSGDLAGGHAVKMLGWGVEVDGSRYWLCANSWGPEWGEEGFFRIRMGEGGIDESVWACNPELPEDEPVVPESPEKPDRPEKEQKSVFEWFFD